MVLSSRATLGAAALLAVSLIPVGALAAPAAAGAPTKIGFLDELTLEDGVTPSWGASTLKGFKLGLKTATALPVEIVTRNVVRSPTDARKAATDLTALAVDAVVGLREDGQALMVKSVTEGKIPFVSVMASSDRLLSEKGTTFALALRNSLQIKAIVDYILAHGAGIKEIASIVTRDDSYCSEMNRLLTEALAAKGIKVQVIANVLQGEQIPHDVLARYDLRHKFIGLFTDEVEGLSFLNLLKERSYKGTVFGGDSWPLPFLGPAFAATQFPTMCLLNSFSFDSREQAAGRKFSASFKAAYGEDSNIMAAMGYDAGMLLGRALAKCAPSSANAEDRRACLSRSMRGMKLDGASGRFQIGSDGGRRVSESLMRSFGACD